MVGWRWQRTVPDWTAVAFLAPGDERGGCSDAGPIVYVVGRHRLVATGKSRVVAGDVIAYTENMADTDPLPDDAPTLNAVLARQQAEIAHLQLWIAKLCRQQFGHRLERAGTLLDQLELYLEELEVGATELDARIESARSRSTTASAPATRAKPVLAQTPTLIIRPRCQESSR